MEPAALGQRPRAKKRDRCSWQGLESDLTRPCVTRSWKGRGVDREYRLGIFRTFGTYLDVHRPKLTERQFSRSSLPSTSAPTLERPCTAAQPCCRRQNASGNGSAGSGFVRNDPDGGTDCLRQPRKGQTAGNPQKVPVQPNGQWPFASAAPVSADGQWPFTAAVLVQANAYGHSKPRPPFQPMATGHSPPRPPFRPMAIGHSTPRLPRRESSAPRSPRALHRRRRRR